MPQNPHMVPRTEPEMSPLRVGIDYRPALLSSTGIARSVRELARALSRLPGIELHLFGHSLARARRGDVPAAGEKLHRLPIPGRLLPSLSRLGLGSERLSGSVPLFHLMDYVHPPLRQAKSILTIHDMAFALNPSLHGERVSAEMLERTRKAAGAASHCVCPSAATASHVASLLEIDPQKLRVIPFGVDHLPEQPAADPLSGRPFLLALGTIEPRKNHLRLLRAWRRLGAERPLLVVIGREGWQCSETVAELRREEAGGKLQWLREANDALVFSHLAHAKALLYPSLLEGFGFPALEALAMGTAVLAGDSPALRELLQDTALFCDPGSEDDIRDQLQRIIQAVAQNRERARAGRRRAAEFCWHRTAEQHLKLYREVMA